MAILKNRLFFKIMASYMVLLLTVVLSLYFFLAYRSHQNYVDLERERLLTAAKILSATVPSVITPQALQHWVEEMGTQAGLRITVIDPQGRVLADNQGNAATMDNHSNRPEVKNALENGNGSSIRFSRTIGKNELYFAYRLHIGEGKTRLILRVAMPLQEISRGFQTTQKGVFLICACLLTLAVGLGYLFTSSLTSRIEGIQEFSENVASGNMGARVEEVTSDELGGLAHSLNKTANVLENKIRELREEKTRVAAIIEGMRAGLLAADSQGRVTLMNPVLARILQVNIQDSLGRKVIEVIRNLQLKEIFDRVLKEKSEVTGTIEIALTSSRIFEVVAVPLRDINDSSSGAVAVLHEITRLKELENVRKDFIANVSHELRTPLTSIQGFAETLLDGALEDKANNRRFVEIIRSHAVGLSDLTMDLLTLATLEAESFQLTYDAVDLTLLVNEVVESIRPIAERKQQDLSIRFEQSLPTLRADRGRLKQVLINLLDNAVKFTPENGKISLEVDRLGDDRVAVHVKDSGIGIPSTDLHRIFERFYRVDKARSREQGGTGLGLAIVKHIVEAHRGTIQVKSLVGQGSDFCFALPTA
jgi:two-component system phosphate regulon sensor histidine kinase PhoR